MTESSGTASAWTFRPRRRKKKEKEKYKAERINRPPGSVGIRLRRATRKRRMSARPPAKQKRPTEKYKIYVSQTKKVKPKKPAKNQKPKGLEKTKEAMKTEDRKIRPKTATEQDIKDWWEILIENAGSEQLLRKELEVLEERRYDRQEEEFEKARKGIKEEFPFMPEELVSVVARLWSNTGLPIRDFLVWYGMFIIKDNKRNLENIKRMKEWTGL